MAQPDLNTSSHFPLFEGLSTEALDEVKRVMRSQTYPANTSLLLMDHRSEMVFLVIEGSVAIFAQREGMLPTLFTILGAGGIIGELSACDGEPHSANVVTREETQVWKTDHATFNTLLDEFPRLCRNLLKIQTIRIRRLSSHKEWLAQLDLSSRLLHQLLFFAGESGQVTSDGGLLIPLRLTQTELGSLIGANRNQVNRILSPWKKQGLLTVDERYHITLLRPHLLLEQTGGQFCLPATVQRQLLAKCYHQ